MHLAKSENKNKPDVHHVPIKIAKVPTRQFAQRVGLKLLDSSVWPSISKSRCWADVCDDESEVSSPRVVIIGKLMPDVEVHSELEMDFQYGAHSANVPRCKELGADKDQESIQMDFSIPIQGYVDQ